MKKQKLLLNYLIILLISLLFTACNCLPDQSRDHTECHGDCNIQDRASDNKIKSHQIPVE